MASQPLGSRIQRSSLSRQRWPARPAMLGLAGDSGSGKATIAAGLVAALGADRAAVVSMDDYHRHDRAEQRDLPETALHPDANYIEIADQHVELLAAGHPVLKPTYDHHTGTLGRPVVAEPREFLVVEGLLALCSPRARACYAAAVYLDTPESLRRRWKLERDTSERGYREEEDHDELDRREPDAEAFVRTQRAHADIVVRFAPVPERGESLDHPLSATILLRPTIAQPNLVGILTDEHKEAIELTLGRDEYGKPADILHVYASAPSALAREVAAGVWAQLGGTEAVPESLGTLRSGSRSPTLALVQLLLVYQLIQAAQA